MIDSFFLEDDELICVYDISALQEVGPRFDLTLFQVKLGTLEQTDAETEYVLRPYMNTAKKRRML